MVNILRLIVSLVEDPDERSRFLDDPEAALRGAQDLTAEDVAAAADVARVQVDPDLAYHLDPALDPASRTRGTPRQAALGALLAISASAQGGR